MIPLYLDPKVAEDIHRDILEQHRPTGRPKCQLKNVQQVARNCNFGPVSTAHLMVQNSVQYVLLQFSIDPQSEGFQLLLAEPHPGESLEVVIPPNWQNFLPAQDQDYLMALIEEWQSTPPDQVPDLFQQLAKLSHGPLRPVDISSTTPEQYFILKRMIANQAKSA